MSVTKLQRVTFVQLPCYVEYLNKLMNNLEYLNTFMNNLEHLNKLINNLLYTIKSTCGC